MISSFIFLIEYSTIQKGGEKEEKEENNYHINYGDINTENENINQFMSSPNPSSSSLSSMNINDGMCISNSYILFLL